MAKKTYVFQIFPDINGEWRWRLVASNGQIIATSGEAFANKRNAQSAARNVSSRAAGAKLVTRT